MLFSRHKKRGREIGQTIENSLKTPFLGSDYLSFNDGKFSPPPGFYKDPYIFGVVFSLSQLFLQFVVQGQNWNNQKKGEYMIEMFSVLDPDGKQELQATFLTGMQKVKADSEFHRGVNDAHTLFGAIYGLIKPDDPDPILVEARARAPELARTANALGLGGNEDSSLGAAVSNLTIEKHIREKYLGD